ncbi:hypothetical protein LSAJ18_200003 [Latilactobacillus sakei]|nr:hypothetical protein LSAJ18_200003 [Latilactobacillus sakei]
MPNRAIEITHKITPDIPLKETFSLSITIASNALTTGYIEDIIDVKLDVKKNIAIT